MRKKMGKKDSLVDIFTTTKREKKNKGKWKGLEDESSGC